ncbi:hypothetical protein N8J89_16625 [Crossiella sp. CA-258035]|uniref:hypothetical protein n=1 Tax=Crossiella sp. CA-258035 TaxID=2981138 RepID=UPI0024BC2336|nr:hypothetical protein [Crossiella sp. CA-258035]WHT22623.1 hypothetical protein N8J89_16625 [Crossiella sp. CA-258035]
MAPKLILVSTFRPAIVAHVAPMLAYGLAQHDETLFVGYPPDGGQVRAVLVDPDHRSLLEVLAATRPVTELLAKIIPEPHGHYPVAHQAWPPNGSQATCGPELIRAAAASCGAEWVVLDLDWAPPVAPPRFSRYADLTLHFPKNTADRLLFLPEDWALRAGALELATWTRTLIPQREADQGR